MATPPPHRTGNQQSVELTVFQEKRSVIHRGILYNVQDIASRAFTRHLLPDRVFRDITGLNQFTADQRTDLLLSELESRITVQAAALTQFLDVLKESDACYIPLVRTISEFLGLSVLFKSTRTCRPLRFSVSVYVCYSLSMNTSLIISLTNGHHMHVYIEQHRPNMSAVAVCLCMYAIAYQ